MVQRPELFRTVLANAPLLDMVRYERFGNTGKWIEEYGTVDDAQDFRALYGYSPYHKVREEIDYPSVLLVAGDRDERCDPLHVRKMAARLQNRLAQKSPIIVDYGLERGHAPALPLSERKAALARRIAFLCRELGVDPAVGGSNVVESD